MLFTVASGCSCRVGDLYSLACERKPHSSMQNLLPGVEMGDGRWVVNRLRAKTPPESMDTRNKCAEQHNRWIERFEGAPGFHLPPTDVW